MIGFLNGKKNVDGNLFAYILIKMTLIPNWSLKGQERYNFEKKQIRRIMENHNIEEMQKLIDYLRSEFAEDKHEFRMVVYNNNQFYIHPLGKDGKSLDLNLYDNKVEK